MKIFSLGDKSLITTRGDVYTCAKKTYLFLVSHGAPPSDHDFAACFLFQLFRSHTPRTQDPSNKVELQIKKQLSAPPPCHNNRSQAYSISSILGCEWINHLTSTMYTFNVLIQTTNSYLLYKTTCRQLITQQNSNIFK